MKLIGLNTHPIPNSTQIIHPTFPSPFVVTSSNFNSNDESPFDYQCKA